MAIAPDHRDNPQTPALLELAYGADRLFWGADAFTFGAPVALPPQIPERLIVRAARETITSVSPSGLPAYATYQPGGRPVLPSIIFTSTGALENETFDRGGLISQDFLIQVRAKRFVDVVTLTTAFREKLHAVAGSRYQGIAGSWQDDYLPTLEYRERSFTVTLRI